MLVLLLPSTLRFDVTFALIASCAGVGLAMHPSGLGNEGGMTKGGCGNLHFFPRSH